mgnify:CR=1 FL=1
MRPSEAKWVFKLRNREVTVERTIYYDARYWSGSISRQTWTTSGVSSVSASMYVYIWGKVYSTSSWDKCYLEGKLSATFKVEWPDKCWLYVVDTNGNHLDWVPITLTGSKYYDGDVVELWYVDYSISVPSSVRALRVLNDAKLVKVEKDNRFPCKYRVVVIERGIELARKHEELISAMP